MTTPALFDLPETPLAGSRGATQRAPWGDLLPGLGPEAVTAHRRLQGRLAALADEGLNPPCAGRADIWFGSPSDRQRAAARCGDCPVAADCLAAGLASTERYGVWGGHDLTRPHVTPTQRRRKR